MLNNNYTTYEEGLEFILKNGQYRPDRTGTGTIGLFGLQMRYNLRNTFPAVTTKKLAWKACLSELLWFIEGSGDERRLAEILYGTRDSSKRTIWTDNAEAPYWKPKAKFEGDLGRVYGVQWRSWLDTKGNSIDQLSKLIEQIKKDPYGRRHILTAWNPAEIENEMALPPCHTFCQFYVNNGELSCQLYQRSADFFLGVPFNIASYALFTHMIAQATGLKAGDFIHSFGDAHIYSNHIDQVNEQLQRSRYDEPVLWVNKENTDINTFTMDDFKLIGYQSHDTIKAPMAV